METTPSIDVQNNEDLTNILETLKKGEDAVKLSINQDIVLLLGNTGSGKSTLAQFLTGSNEHLISVEVGNNSGEFVIVDQKGKISNNSTIISQTIYPELMISESTRTIYYDCPGFSDTRSAANDIAGTYFIKKVIQAARSVKLIFVINYPSVRRGVDRQDFMLLVKHAVNLIKDMERYKESIAIIVTKVDNQYINRGRTLVDDHTVINNIADFIKGVSQELEKKSGLQIDGLDKEYFYNSAQIFVKSLVVKGKDEYKKIGIFRRPDDFGPLNKNELLQDGKKTLLEIIHAHTNFVERKDNDFGYTISAESKNHVYGLIEEIIARMAKNIANIGTEMEEQYNSSDERVADIDKMKENFDFALNSFLETRKITMTQEIIPRDFINSIYSVTKKLKMEISEKHLSNFLELEDYLRFLYAVSNKQPENIPINLKLVNGLEHHLQYLQDAKNWYKFLSNFYNRMSEYDVQKDIAKLNEIQFLKQISEKSHVKISDVLSGFPISAINVTGYDGIKNLYLDKTKLLSLKRVMNITLNHSVEFKCTGYKLRVKGEFVILGDVIGKRCTEKLKFLEVYATNKVFIDKSIRMIGEKLQFVMMAPTWEVIGQQEIVLDGIPGNDWYPYKASRSGWAGENGMPGFPGGAAGSFVGVGKHFIKGHNLKISANGGRGGRGQDGGDGVNGNARPGGPGGNGGAGGLGGNEGQVSVIELGPGVSDIRISKRPGSEGEGGLGGKGGTGGVIVQEPKHTWMQWVPILNLIDAAQAASSGSSVIHQPDGISGSKGLNVAGRRYPEPPAGYIHPPPYIKEFMNYITEKSETQVKKSFFQDIITRLKDNKIIRQRRSIINASDKRTTVNNVNEDMFAEKWEITKTTNNIYKSVDGLLPPSNQFKVKEQVPNMIENEIASNKDYKIMSTLDGLQNHSRSDFLDKMSSPMFNSYSDLSSNLLLWEVVMKKLNKNKSKLNKTYSSEKGSKKDIFASDLAYRYYAPK